MGNPAQHQFRFSLTLAVALTAIFVSVASSTAWTQTPLVLDPGITEPRGLAWDGNRFWLIGGFGGDEDFLIGIDPQNGNLVRVELPGSDFKDPSVLAWQESDGTFWVADDRTRLISKLEINQASSSVNVISAFEGPDQDRSTLGISGIEWDGRQDREGLWVCTSLGLCTTIRKLDVREDNRRRVMTSLYPVCDPRGLAILGESLWTVAYGRTTYASKLLNFDISNTDWQSIKASRDLRSVVAGRAPVGLSRRAGTLWVLDQEEKAIRVLKIW